MKSWDRLASDLAARQHGVVARRQLVRRGMPRHWIDYRLRRGRFRAVHHGVYRIGPVAAPLEKPMAAVLACGDSAALSHRSAGALWRMVARDGWRGPIDVTLSRGARARRKGIHARLIRSIRADELTTFARIPVTTPARTLLDLAATLSPDRLERASAIAAREHPGVAGDIAKLLDRHPRSAGRSVLRSLLDRSTGPELTRSEAESRFLALVRRSRLPPPAVNVRVEGLEVDFLWRRERLIVETDGFAFHGSPAAFERDRARDGRLLAAGYRVLRITWRQLESSPETVLVQVAQALARASTPAS